LWSASRAGFGGGLRIPTDAREADGTLEWDRTVLVVVEVEAGGETGLGYTYSDASIVPLIENKLASVIVGHSAFDIAGANLALWRSIRNLGRSGLVATAISAVDAAVWDLKAKLLGVSVTALLGCCRDTVPIYGSDGFTSYGDPRLREQPRRLGRERRLSLGQNENRQRPGARSATGRRSPRRDR
jgi:L-alanine-DL-glutamate epimerase-like enolase superfamily enzyme